MWTFNTHRFQIHCTLCPLQGMPLLIVYSFLDIWSYHHTLHAREDEKEGERERERERERRLIKEQDMVGCEAMELQPTKTKDNLQKMPSKSGHF